MNPPAAHTRATPRASRRPIGRRWTARSAAAAGIAGLLANALLAGYYALQVGREQLGMVSLGSLNDLVGALGTVLMIPVALMFGPRWVRAVGLAAMGVLTVAGPLLVVGLVPFAVHLPVALTASLVLAAWMLLTSRHAGNTLPVSVSRWGTACGGSVLAGAAVVGAALLLPSTSWPQLILFVVGGVPVALGWLGTPVWFLLLARALR